MLGGVVLLGSFAVAEAAQSVFSVQQGGTGAQTFTSSNLLYGAGTNPIKSVATTSAACSGTVSCAGFTVIGTSPITITGAAAGSFPFSADTNYGQVVYSTSTPTLWFKSGFFASSTSQIQQASTTLISAVTASTTNLVVSSAGGAGTRCAQFAVDGTISATSAACNTGTVTQIIAGLGLNGGTITTTGTVSLISYIATSTGETQGNLAYWTTTNGTPAKLSTVATSTASCTGGVSCTSFSVIAPGAISITNSGVTSLVAGNGISISGSTGAVTVNQTSYVATSTGETAGNLAYYTSTNGTPASIGKVATTTLSLSSGLATTSGTIGALVGGSNSIIGQVERRGFTELATTTSIQGTTTIPLEIGYGETWNFVQCWTFPAGATMDFDFYYNTVGGATTHILPFTVGSSTPGKMTFTSNNVIPANATTSVDVGTPANSPTRASCTVNDTI